MVANAIHCSIRDASLISLFNSRCNLDDGSRPGDPSDGDSSQLQGTAQTRRDDHSWSMGEAGLMWMNTVSLGWDDDTRRGLARRCQGSRTSPDRLNLLAGLRKFTWAGGRLRFELCLVSIVMTVIRAVASFEEVGGLGCGRCGDDEAMPELKEALMDIAL
jgi:hypothetical protein